MKVGRKARPSSTLRAVDLSAPNRTIWLRVGMAHMVVPGEGFGRRAVAHELRRNLPVERHIALVAAEDRRFVGFARGADGRVSDLR